jgi:hypothetical protein
MRATPDTTPATRYSLSLIGRIGRQTGRDITAKLNISGAAEEGVSSAVVSGVAGERARTHFRAGTCTANDWLMRECTTTAGSVR